MVLFFFLFFLNETWPEVEKDIPSSKGCCRFFFFFLNSGRFSEKRKLFLDVSQMFLAPLVWPLASEMKASLDLPHVSKVTKLSVEPTSG